MCTRRRVETGVCKAKVSVNAVNAHTGWKSTKSRCRLFVVVDKKSPAGNKKSTATNFRLRLRRQCGWAITGVYGLRRQMSGGAKCRRAEWRGPVRWVWELCPRKFFEILHAYMYTVQYYRLKYWFGDHRWGSIHRSPGPNSWWGSCRLPSQEPFPRSRPSACIICRPFPSGLGSGRHIILL